MHVFYFKNISLTHSTEPLKTDPFYVHEYAHTRSHLQTLTNTQTHRHTDTHTQTHTQIHINTHTHTHTHSSTHTPTHIHTHTSLCQSPATSIKSGPPPVAVVKAAVASRHDYTASVHV